MSYIKTKFFRFLVRAKKTTQLASRDVYQFVPLQDFNKYWTDCELYEKYELTQNQIDYIEKIIPEMEIPELELYTNTEEEIQYIEDNIDPMGDQEDLEDAFSLILTKKGDR